MFVKIVLSLCFLSVMSVNAEPMSEETAGKLVSAIGKVETTVESVKNFLPKLKKMYPNKGDEFWENYISKLNPDDLKKLLIPVYQKHFSEEEGIEIIEFSKTSAGQKFIQSYPNVFKESFEVSRQWARSLDQTLKQ